MRERVERPMEALIEGGVRLWFWSRLLDFAAVCVCAALMVLGVLWFIAYVRQVMLP